MYDLLAFQPSLKIVIIMLQLFQHKILCIAGLIHTSEPHIPLLIYLKAPESCTPRISWCCSLVNAMDLLTQTLYIPGLLFTLMLILPLYACMPGHWLWFTYAPFVLWRVVSSLTRNCGLALGQAGQWTSLPSSGLQLPLLYRDQNLSPGKGTHF